MKSRLPQIIAKLPVVTQDAVKDAAERIATRAKVAAPVRTGALKNSIEAKPIPRARGEGIRYGVYAQWYWFLVEFGHEAGPEGSRGGAAPPHPFMVPGAEGERAELYRDIKGRLDRL